MRNSKNFEFFASWSSTRGVFFCHTRKNFFFIIFQFYFLFLKFNLINFPCHHIFSVIINQMVFFSFLPKNYFLFFFYHRRWGKITIFFSYVLTNVFHESFSFSVFTKINKVWPVLLTNGQRSREASQNVHNRFLVW